MQGEVGQILCFHGPKGAQANVKGDMGQGNTPLCNCCQQVITEMQSRRRSSNSAWTRGVTGLIALLIRAVMPCDVRRKRHFSVALQQSFQGKRIRAFRRELHDPTSAGRIARQHG